MTFKKRTSIERFLLAIDSFTAFYLLGNEWLQKICWQEGHKACRILHKVSASDWIPSVCKEFKAPGEHPCLNKSIKMGIEKEVEIWYAMRATYRREPDAMHLLKKENLGCFIPMQYKICIKKRKKVRALVPVVHNLLFVHARPSGKSSVSCPLNPSDSAPLKHSTMPP